MAGTPDAEEGGEPAAPGVTGASEPARPVEASEPARPVDRWRRRWQERVARLREQARHRAKEWWPKIRPVLRELRWPDEPPPTLTIVDRRVPPPLLVPAQGQVYSFVVRATFTWSTDLARPELFGWYVDYFQPQASQRLRRIAIRCAREYPPHRPREVEIALDAALTGEDALPWRYERGDVTFSCEPDVSVHLDEPVRRLLQPYWDRRIALEFERDLDRQRADHQRDLDQRRADHQRDLDRRHADREHERDRRHADHEDERDRPSPPPTSGVPGEPGDGHPPEQRTSDPLRRTAGLHRQPPQPDSSVEQFTPLEPLLPPPAPRPPHPATHPTPPPTQSAPRSAPAPRVGPAGTGGGSPASTQRGESASPGADHPEPSED